MTPKTYFRPLPQFGAGRPDNAATLAGGWCWFDHVETLTRDGPPRIVPVSEVPAETMQRLIAPRPGLAGLRFDWPVLMGILNVTPDSFSDGGDHHNLDQAVTRAQKMASEVEIIDIGGESTRPGAADVAAEVEIARTAPVIEALRAAGLTIPISIDTRKALVARTALASGADIVNDVSGLRFDRDLAQLVAEADVPLCLMHSVETPKTMQNNPIYDDVLLDTYDFLQDSVDIAVKKGISRRSIIVDPGIGFGKTLHHNLALLARLSLFHGLGCPILLGASRKKFIGTIGNVAEARSRAPGSLAVALAAIGQGVQIIRAHDTAETQQAVRLFMAANTGRDPEEEQ